jgi:hypothetical protein
MPIPAPHAGTVNDAGTPDRGGATRTSSPADRDPTLLAARHLARSELPSGEIPADNDPHQEITRNPARIELNQGRSE